MRYAFTIVLALLAAACAPQGGGSADYGTAWQGIISAGPVSIDGAVTCGVPRLAAFSCEAGYSVQRTSRYVACIADGSPVFDDWLDTATVGGDWVRIGVGGDVEEVGRTQGGILSRQWCVREGRPVQRGWLGQRYVIATLDREIERCWHPVTGLDTPCADLGRPSRD